MSIELLSPEQQDASAVQVAACQFDQGHDWIDITHIGQIGRHYMCSGCGAKGHDPDFRDIDWS